MCSYVAHTFSLGNKVLPFHESQVCSISCFKWDALLTLFSVNDSSTLSTSLLRAKFDWHASFLALLEQIIVAKKSLGKFFEILT